MKRCRLIAILILALVCTFASVRSSSAADRYSMISVHPNQDLGHYFFVQEAETLPKFKWSLGMMMLYYNELLNIKWETVLVSPGGTRTIRVDERHGIDNLVYDYFYGAVGLTDWLTLAVDFPLFVYYKYGWTVRNIDSSTNQYFKPGDIWLSAKFRLLDMKKHGVGVALIPSISIPTGKDSHFLGDQNVTGQGQVVVEMSPVDKLRMSFNIALHTREKVTINDINFRNTLKFAVGASYKVVDNVSLIGELESHTVTNDFYGSKRTSPAEARVAARWRPGGGRWMVGGGASGGIVSGVGMPRFGVFASLGYSTAYPKRERNYPKFQNVESYDQCVRVAADDGTQTSRYLVMCKAYFGFDETKSDNYKAILDIVDLIKNARGKVKVEIRGWTDAVGTEIFNKGLSLQRAQYVAVAIENALGDMKKKAKIRVLGIGEDESSPPEKARRADTLLK